MPHEIERKFLVVHDSWRAVAGRGRRLRQAYIATTDRAVVRVRVMEGGEAFLTIKSAEPGLSRSEFEYGLPVADAQALIELRQGPVLEKTRFEVAHAGQRWEIDVYSGDNDGLVVAEIELERESTAVVLPSWVGREVTGEARYYAAELARNPFWAWAAHGCRGCGQP